MTKFTKETLGEALDCSYESDSGINCHDLNHAHIILEAAQRLYDNYDALKALHEVGEKATQGEWTVHQCQECHVPSDRLSFHYPIREADGVTEIIPDENGDQDYPNIPHDMVFAATAANTRPAIRNLIGDDDDR